LEKKSLTVALDSNILCYALESAYPEHESLKNLLLNLSSENTVAVNPTVIHETYHVLVFYLQWLPEEAAHTLSMLLKHPYVEFFNQTQIISQLALNLSVKHNLGGRDSLIAANFLANKVPTMFTHDQQLLELQKMSWKNHNLTFQDPLERELKK
jgi:predicted nucleic acid-binding protein